MKPVAFDYARPVDLASAAAMARREDIVVKFIAGGQSLGPMLNLRLVQPDLLVDLTGLGELKHVELTADALVIGACVTHADIEDGRVPDIGGGVLRVLAAGIAYRAVRNRGTIGGSICHADPAADWLSCLAALGASVVITDGVKPRVAAIEDFVTGVFENTLLPGELVEAISIPRLSARARWGFYKVCRKTGEFGHAIGAVLHDPVRSVSRAVIGATAPKPILWANAAALFGGVGASGDTLKAQASEALRQAGVGDPVEQQIRIVALRRAAKQAGLA